MTVGDALSLDIAGEAAGIVVRTRGALDATNGPLLEEALTELSVDPVNLRVDLRGVSAIDEDGLRVLWRLSERCRANGGTLTLSSPPPPVLALMRTHPPDTAIEIREDRETT